MKIGENISKADKQKMKSMAALNEKLSRRDLEELMGTNRETYKRIRGSVRRK